MWETLKDLVILITGILTIVFHPNLYKMISWLLYTIENSLFGSEKFLNVKLAKDFRREKDWIHKSCDEYIMLLSKQYTGEYLISSVIDIAIDSISLRHVAFWYYVYRYFHGEGLMLFYTSRGLRKRINYME